MNPLAALLDDPATTREQLWETIEGTPEAQRPALLSQIGGVRRQKRMWDLAEGGPDFGIEAFLPSEDAPPLVAQPWSGKNSLPLFSDFQKIMYRSKDGTKVFGRNAGLTAPVIGHGYFEVARDDSGLAPVVFHYTSQPEASDRPEGWPAIKSNTRGLSTLVYGNMHDFMRMVGPGVYVGEAWKKTKNMNSYFTLVLMDQAAGS